MRLALLPLLVACGSKTVEGDEAGPEHAGDTSDTGSEDTGDTGRVDSEETGDSGETGSGDSEETGDTGDTGDSEETGDAAPVLIQAYEYADCEDVDCLWSVEADGMYSSVDLWLLPTGDAAFEPGCADVPTSAGQVCGVWAEHHDAFRVVDDANAWGGMTRALTLATVTSPDEQVGNATTLYSGVPLGVDVTWLLVLTDTDGIASDCATFGHDPYYFAASCPNRF